MAATLDRRGVALRAGRDLCDFRQQREYDVGVDGPVEGLCRGGREILAQIEFDQFCSGARRVRARTAVLCRRLGHPQRAELVPYSCGAGFVLRALQPCHTRECEPFALAVFGPQACSSVRQISTFDSLSTKLGNPS